MDTLKKLFPFSFKKKGTLTDLIINIVIHVVVGFLAGTLIALFAKLPIIGIIIGLFGGIVDLYVVAGIVLSVLDYAKILK